MGKWLFFGEKKVKKLRIYFFQISGSKSILKIHRKKFSPLLFLNLATASLDTSTLIQLFDLCKICIFSSQLIQFSLLFTTDSLTIKWIEAAVAAAVAIAEAILLQHISGGREKFKNNPGQKKTREIKSINLEFYFTCRKWKIVSKYNSSSFHEFFTWDF